MGGIAEELVRVRLAGEADVFAIESLLRAIPGVWQASWRGDCVERCVVAAEGLAMLAEAGGMVVGFAAAHDTGFRGYLSELAVAEEWQGRGVGCLLLAAVERALVARGCGLVVADVFPPAEGFYRKRGWGYPASVLMSHRTMER